MFYARCALSTVQARRLGYADRYNYWLSPLSDPAETLNSYANLVRRDDPILECITPLFPISVPTSH